MFGLFGASICVKFNPKFYVQLEPNAEGIIFSEVFPGLRLDKFALLSGDLAKVLEVLPQGLTAAEHQSFVGSSVISH